MNVRSVLPRDAIPSIDEPAFGRTYFGDPDDEVIVVDGAPARAYPLRILSYHEIVNDRIDERPIAVTWCPICWSAAVYERVVDGRTLTFGMSGKLADDALIMYDRETGSEWKQPTGTAFDGELAGHQLEALPSPIVTWDRFTRDHPDGVVLQPEGSTGRPGERYDMTPYHQYANGDEFGLYGMRGEGPRRSWDRDDIDAKTVVLGIERNGASRAYPVDRVVAEGNIVTDTLGGVDLVVFATEDGIHAFERAELDFVVREGAIEADGTTWNPVTGKSGDGRRLARVAGRRLFAFAWQDAHGPDAFYDG